jgi:hypothetical protein
MNTESPPNASNPYGEGTTSLGSDAPMKSGRGKRGWKSIAVIAGVAVIAGAIGLSLYLTQRSNSMNESATPERGLACPYLRRAAEARAQGDLVTYDKAINQAREVAEHVLQRSGEVFGEPERIALQLGLGQHADITTLLDRADSVCSRLIQ